jgi:hypothetical protein
VFTASITSQGDHHATAENWRSIADGRVTDLERQMPLQLTAAFGTVNYSAEMMI